MGERAAESDSDLIRFLEKTAGRELRTRDDIRRFLEEISGKRPESSPATRLWHTAKQGMWLLLLVAAYLQYYFLDILVQIESIPNIRVSVPPVSVPQSSRSFRL